MSNSNIDVFLNINNGFQKIVRLNKEDEKYCRSLSKRGGSVSRYPWLDPSYKIGDSFFKAMSKEEIEADKGRPSIPPGVRSQGVLWSTKGIYREDVKQYGYKVTRVN